MYEKKDETTKKNYMGIQVAKKIIWSLLSANIIQLLAVVFMFGSWTTDFENHEENDNIHFDTDTLRDQFMPRREAEANYKTFNQKLDLLIELQKQ